MKRPRQGAKPPPPSEPDDAPSAGALPDVELPGAGLPGETPDDDASTIDRVRQGIATAGAAAGRFLETARHLTEPEVARLHNAGRSALPNLFELHPEARSAPRRPLGLVTIRAHDIRGTAVEGPAQRGGDFLPWPALRGRNWEGRWQRLLQAQERLAVLPPIDAFHTADGYWVIDGHNRVAAALYGGQDDIDAIVTHLHLPGEEDSEPRAGSLAAGLAEMTDLRAAGEGRLARGAAVRRRRRTE